MDKIKNDFSDADWNQFVAGDKGVENQQLLKIQFRKNFYNNKN